MLKMQPLVDWTNGLGLALGARFTAGPDIPEYGNGDRVGTITAVPGGGLVRQETFEQVQMQWLMRSRVAYQSDLESSVETLDAELRAIENQLIWGTYVRYVFRLGSLVPEVDEPEERVLFTGNYLIEIGL